MNTDDVDYKLISRLTMDGRISLLELSRATGLSYTAIRNRLRRLLGNGHLQVKPVVSARLAGTTGAVLRVKVSRPHRLIEKLSKCNRVIGFMSMRGEVVAFLYSTSKKEAAFTIDRIISECDGVEEYSIEYGRLPPDAKLMLRNPMPDCRNCIYYKLGLCSGCLPTLRSKGAR